MSSMFERPELNKIFLVYGNLDDMFISPDLQKNNFRPFLNSYLRSLGYEQIVFYSGAKNTGKYVLDDRSAVLAINKNKHKTGTATTDYNPSSSDCTPKKKRRILSPRAQSKEPAVTSNADSSLAQTSNQTTDNSSEVKLIYKQPKITPAEFLDDAKKIMADSRIKSAIVFTFFQDFVTDGSAPLQQYSELLSHLWDEYALNSNENICIFLAPQMDATSISHLFDSLTSGDVFRNRFFNNNKTINRSCTIHIGLPNQDEFRYMLDYLRIVGDSGKNITFKRSEMPKIVSSLMYLSREADREENRAGYLSSVYENIVWFLKQQDADAVSFWPVMKRICKGCTNPIVECVQGLRKSTSETIAQQKCIKSLLCSATRLDMQSLMELKNTIRQSSKKCRQWSTSPTDAQRERYMKKRLRT